MSDMSAHVLRLLLVAFVCDFSFGLNCKGSNTAVPNVGSQIKKEWHLAFRGTQGINKSVYEAYTTNQTNEVDLECKDPFNDSCFQHYRDNEAIEAWANIDQVEFSIYKDGLKVHHILFDGQGSTNMNWFADSRIVSSSWVDLKNETKNFFSIPGQGMPNSCNTVRRFFINRNYGGCSKDAGWFSATDLPKESTGSNANGKCCIWEQNDGVFPVFLYAQSTYVNWKTAVLTGTVGRADAIAVHLKRDGVTLLAPFV